MDMITQHGFCTVVVNPDGNDPDELSMRFRSPTHLENFRKLFPGMGPKLALQGRDYNYRAYISRADFTTGMMNLANDIDYKSFKTRLKKVNHKLYNAVVRLWEIMLSQEEGPHHSVYYRSYK
jgi:hypothetical protein